MPEAGSEIASQMDRRYPEFVRLAYLVLPEGGSRKYRLALACRIAGEAMPRRPVTDLACAAARTRTRVLARAMRLGRMRRLRLRVGLRRWPAGPLDAFPEIPGSDHLRELTPEVRVAYVLRKVEAQYRCAVHDQLVKLGVRDARAVVDAADLLAPRTDLATPAVPVPLPDVPRGPRLRSRRPLAVAVAVTALLVGGIVGTGSNRGSAQQDGTRRPVGAAGWPARGDLAGDRAFGRSALAAWRSGRLRPKTYGGATARPPARNARLIYAGRQYGAQVALLADPGRIARYVKAGSQAGRQESLELFPAGRSGATPLVLADNRYLLPPGVSWVRSATAGGPWQPATVHDGVASVEPADGPLPGGCWNGPILNVQGRTAADLSGLQLATLILSGWTAGAAPEPAALACALPRPAGPVGAAAVTRFWAGKLPDGTPGSWTCARYAYLNGRGDARATFFEGHAHYATGGCGTAADGSVSGMWWSPGTDPGVSRWYYIAAASPGLKVKATGPFRTTGYKSALFVGEGASGVRPPKGKVTVTAVPE